MYTSKGVGYVFWAYRISDSTSKFYGRFRTNTTQFSISFGDIKTYRSYYLVLVWNKVAGEVTVSLDGSPVTDITVTQVEAESPKAWAKFLHLGGFNYESTSYGAELRICDLKVWRRFIVPNILSTSIKDYQTGLYSFFLLDPVPH